MSDTTTVEFEDTIELEELEPYPRMMAVASPTIVCLCGSTRFRDAFLEANERETYAGRIVLTIGMTVHGDWTPTREEKARLDVLHMAKIDLADEVLVLDVDGYIGESTEREVAYAEMRGKKIRRWSEETGR